MTVTIGGKEYTMKEDATLGLVIGASRLSEEFGAAYNLYLTDTSAKHRRDMERKFKHFCNAIFVQRWYAWIGIKTFRASIMQIPMKEVKSLQENFFSIIDVRTIKS